MLGRTLHPTPCIAYSHIGASRSCCGPVVGLLWACCGPVVGLDRTMAVARQRRGKYALVMSAPSDHPLTRRAGKGSADRSAPAATGPERPRCSAGQVARRREGVYPYRLSGVMIAHAAAPGKTAFDAARANQFDEPGTSCRGTFTAKRNSDADVPHPATTAKR
jgi:hypothetical protein